MKKAIFILMLAVMSSCASTKFTTTECTVRIDNHVVHHEMQINWEVRRKVVISSDENSTDVNPRSMFQVSNHSVIYEDEDERWEWK